MLAGQQAQGSSCLYLPAPGRQVCTKCVLPCWGFHVGSRDQTRVLVFVYQNLRDWVISLGILWLFILSFPSWCSPAAQVRGTSVHGLLCPSPRVLHCYSLLLRHIFENLYYCRLSSPDVFLLITKGQCRIKQQLWHRHGKLQALQKMSYQPVVSITL